MLSMIVISSGALVIAIIGCAVIWGMDAQRANEIERPPVPGRHTLGAATRTSAPGRLPGTAAPTPIPVAIPVTPERRPDVRR